MTETDHAALARPDVLGRLLADATGDDRWLGLHADLITGGKSNLTFLLASAAGELVLRRPPAGTVLATAHDMKREARVQQALVTTVVPVADILLTDDGASIGVPFYVMRKVSGEVLREKLPPAFGVAQCRMLGEALVDVLAGLHGIDPDAVGLADFGRPAGFLERQLRRWRGQWEASVGTPTPALDELADRLGRSIPSSTRPSIVHGDYRLDNCIVRTDGSPLIAAVLDWELSTLGDPLTDLGMLQFYWADAPTVIPSIIQSVTTSPGFPSADDVAQRWSTRTGIAADGVDWYRAFAHFKFAVIAAGIAARVRAGAMGGQNFGDLAGEIAATAESGLAQLTA